MSAKKRMKDVRDAKDRRAKKLAIGGAVVLVAVLAYQMSHMLGGSKAAAPPASTTTTVAGAPGATPVTTTPPGTAAAAVLPTTGSTKLTNSDVEPARSKSTLYSFSDFSGKNPFAQQLSATTGSSSGTTGGTSSGTTTTPTPGTTVTASVRKASAKPNSSVSSPRSLAQTGTVTILVNGRSDVVRVGAGFPSGNPLFRLVSVSHGVARIGIANGSYASGAHTVSLVIGRTLTLVDTADGIRYKLELRTAG
jgi:hypothetical protein